MKILMGVNASLNKLLQNNYLRVIDRIGLSNSSLSGQFKSLNTSTLTKLLKFYIILNYINTTCYYSYTH